MTHRIPQTLGLLLLLLLPVSDPIVAADEPSTPGVLRVHEPEGIVEMPLEHTSVSVEITAFVARTTVEQKFGNPFDHPVEAVYTFPLGDRAAVDDFELVVGDRIIRGEIRRREEARQVYEAARSAGYQAALLEQERPNIFTQSVANLEPGGGITIRLRTVEVLRYEAGVYQFTFPLVVGPRYIPGSGASIGVKTTRPAPGVAPVPDTGRITPPVLKPGFRSGHDVEISVQLDAGVPIADLSSPSHRIRIERPTSSSGRVRLAAGDTIPNKDFMLRWNVSSERPAVGLLAHRDGVDGFFSLLVQPKAEVSKEEAAPKEIILVLDTSGSMRGIPLEASKRLARVSLETLGPRDTFNLVRFAGTAETFSPEPLANDSHSIERALRWLEGLAGGGGTEMVAGFRTAFARPRDPNRLRLVVFLTDGYIGNEHEILTEVGKVVAEARIYTLGIGSSVNHYLLDRMADLGGGAYVFVRPDGREVEAVDRFRAWVTRPYLTDIEVDWGALPVADMVPERPRDVHSGQTLTIVGRYVGAAEGDIVVRGRLGGRYWEQRQRVVLPDLEKGHAALGSLWARHRIEELLLSSPAEATGSIRAEVTALALEYRLMSPFTSFVAVDDSRVVNPGGTAETVQQALPMPEGVSFAGVFGVEGPPRLQTVEGPEDFIQDLPVTGRHYQDVMAVAPGGVAAASARDFKAVVAGERAPLSIDETEVISGAVAAITERVVVEARKEVVDLERSSISTKIEDPFERARAVNRPSPAVWIPSEARSSRLEGARFEPSRRLWEAALRILADLAEDGRLSSSEGRPSLAALLGAQASSGAIAQDVVAHTLAAWALAEAAVVLPRDPWVKQASSKALDYLATLKRPEGWPARPGGEADGEATLWARLVLERFGVPVGAASPEYERIREALSAAATRSPSNRPTGRGPLDRLAGALGRGHLAIMGGRSSREKSVGREGPATPGDGDGGAQRLVGVAYFARM